MKNFIFLYLNFFVLFFFLLILRNHISQQYEITTIGDKDFRYVNFATFSNGDMIVETMSDKSSKRMFYGINSEGRPLFNSLSTGKKTNYYSIEPEEQQENRYESEIFIVTNDEGKEFLVNIEKNQSYIELYDFNENRINKINTTNIQMNSIIGTIFNYYWNANKYIIFAFTKNDYICLKSFYFENNTFNEGLITFEKDNNSGYLISCFVTDSKYTKCIYLCYIQLKIYYKTRKYNYICIIALDNDLIEKKDISFKI